LEQPARVDAGLRGAPAHEGGRERLPVLDALRGLAICWITAYHFLVDARGVEAWSWATPSAFFDALGHADARAALRVLATVILARSTFRTDIFLLLTGVALTLAPPARTSVFLWRRLQAVLPGYWLGSLLVAAALFVCAALRSAVTGAPFASELEHGARLAGLPYRFEPLDLIRSFSIVGRLTSARAMQVVAPSLWYVLLVLQVYLAFPLLRHALRGLGRVRFLVLCLLVTWAGRALLFRLAPLAAVDPGAASVYWLPFRLAPLVLGMVAAARARPLLRRPPAPSRALALAAPGLVLLAAAAALGAHANAPGTLPGALGPIVPMMLGLPALWSLAAASQTVPKVAGLVAGAGRRSLSILVVQDVLRFAAGSAIALRFDVSARLLVLGPLYLAVALALARLWDPLPRRLADRFWPRDVPAGSRTLLSRTTRSRPSARPTGGSLVPERDVLAPNG
jgi:peptidoglycan/LPS O-acetylase OafA/YrhL